MTYGCYNRKPFAKSYVAQAGWKTIEGDPPTREPIWKNIPHRNTTDCQYSLHRDDPGCAGCKWKQELQEEK